LHRDGGCLLVQQSSGLEVRANHPAYRHWMSVPGECRLSSMLMFGIGEIDQVSPTRVMEAVRVFDNGRSLIDRREDEWPCPLCRQRHRPSFRCHSGASDVGGGLRLLSYPLQRGR
jgi:hypothetical protein